MPTDVIQEIRKELEKNADNKTIEMSHRFFKEEVKVIGVKLGIVSKIAKKYFEEIKNFSKEDIFNLCEELLASDYSEEAWIAFEWAEKIHRKMLPKDWEIFEHWINKYVNNWAKCDTLCNHAVGSFIELYPQYSSELLKWAHSNNRWFRRAAAVSLILPVRRGGFLRDVFKIADILLLDEDDLVQKGYGWMLKEACREHQKEVFDYVIKNKNVMPRTALRYAIEKMSSEMKERAMS